MAMSDDMLVKSLDGFTRSLRLFIRPVDDFAEFTSSFARSVFQFGKIVDEMEKQSKQEKEEAKETPSPKSAEPSIINGPEYNRPEKPPVLEQTPQPAPIERVPSPVQQVLQPQPAEETMPVMEPQPASKKSGGIGQLLSVLGKSGGAAEAGGGAGIEGLLSLVAENPEILALLLADGGKVTGPGTGTSDSIPAWLSRDEFVVNAKDATKHSHILESINSGRGVPAQATGGWAGHPASAPKFARGTSSGVLGLSPSMMKGLENITAGTPINEFVKAGNAVAKFTEELKHNTDDIIESRRNLAEVSPGMASVFAQKDIQEVFMNIERGERLTESTDWAQRQNIDFQKAMIPIETLVGKIENYVSGAFSATMASVLEWINRNILWEDNETFDKVYISDMIENIADRGKTQAWRDRQAQERVRDERKKMNRRSDLENLFGVDSWFLR